MMPLDCINNERFQDLCYEINPRFQIPCINTIKNKMMESIFYTKSTLKDMFKQTITRRNAKNRQNFWRKSA